MTNIKKETEKRHLFYFLKARESATGEKIAFLNESESPDFICVRQNGAIIGIEITRIGANPEQQNIDDLWLEDGEWDSFELINAALVALNKKEAKRKKAYWRFPEATILVFDFIEKSLFEEWTDELRYSNEFKGSGFLEIWVLDHSSIETHGTATAIGLYPNHIWGVQGQHYLHGPPYG